MQYNVWGSLFKLAEIDYISTSQYLFAWLATRIIIAFAISFLPIDVYPYRIVK